MICNDRIATFSRRKGNPGRSERVKIGSRKRLDSSIFQQKIEKLTSKIYEDPTAVPDSVHKRMSTVTTIVEYLNNEDEGINGAKVGVNSDAVKELLDFLNADFPKKTEKEIDENEEQSDLKKKLLKELKNEANRRSSEAVDLARTSGIVELVDLLYSNPASKERTEHVEEIQEKGEVERTEEMKTGKAPVTAVRRVHERRPSLVGLMEFLQSEPPPKEIKTFDDNTSSRKTARTLRKVSNGRSRGFKRITAVFTRSNAGDLEEQLPVRHHLGMALKELCEISKSNVPVAIRLAVVHLQAKRVENIEGVFRLSANKDELDAFVSSFDKSAILEQKISLYYTTSFNGPLSGSVGG